LALIRRQPLSPLFRLVLLAPGFVELDDPGTGFGEELLAPEERYSRFALAQAFVAIDEHRLGLGVFLLAGDGTTQEAERVELQPQVGKALVRDSERSARRAFGLGGSSLLEPQTGERVEHHAVVGAFHSRKQRGFLGLCEELVGLFDLSFSQVAIRQSACRPLSPGAILAEDPAISPERVVQEGFRLALSTLDSVAVSQHALGP
jgi:hypothetical protein